MDIRKYLLEQLNSQQSTAEQQAKKLKNAVDVGCFTGSIVVDKNAEPIEEPGSQPYVQGKVGNDDVKITVEPNLLINLTQEKLPVAQRTQPIKRSWNCKSLDNLYVYLNKIQELGWTTKEPTELEIGEGNVLVYNLKTGLTWSSDLNKFVAPAKNDNRYKQLETFFKYTSPMLANSTQGINVYKTETDVSDITNVRLDDRDCEESVTKLYNYYTRDEKADSDRIKVEQENVQNCVYQGRLRSGNVRVGPPNLFNKQKQKRIEDVMDELFNMSWQDPWQKQFRITRKRGQNEGKLVFNVKKNLMDAYEKKQAKLIEADICKKRLDLIIENMEEFKKFNTPKKIGKGFRYLREASQLRKLGLLNEELGNLFQQIFGKSLDGILTNVSEPLLTSIFDKIDLPEDIKTDVVNRIHSKTTELLANMDNCENLTNFLSTQLSEALADKIMANKLIGSELIDNSLNELVKGENFKQNISSKLHDNICALFEKFSENAKNLVTKLSEV
jgi:hypothetical protein